MLRFAPILQSIPLLAAVALAGCAQDPQCLEGDPACGPDDALPTDGAPTDQWGDPIGTGGGSTTGNATNPTGLDDIDGDGYRPVDGDCDDNEPTVHPDGVEVCDELDNDCNGFVDDNLGRTSVSETDSGADGIPDSWSYTTYMPTGQLWFRETDSGADGTIDSSESYVYTYDSMGRLTSIETDTGMDGTVDKIKTYYYDGLGRLIRTEEDRGPDGIPDRIDTYVYDPVTGVRIAWEMDTDGDGFPNTVYNYDYDANGTLQGLSLDRYNTDGQITSSMLYDYEYLPNGQLGWVHTDLTGDGVFDNMTEYTYDQNGRTDHTAYDIGRDGVWNSLTWYRYNTITGATEKIEIDSNGDYVLDTRIRRWEECDDTPLPP